MALSWGVLLPVGAVLARNFKTASPLWFHIHRAIQVPRVAPFLLTCLAHVQAPFKRQDHAFCLFLGERARPLPALRSCLRLASAESTACMQLSSIHFFKLVAGRWLAARCLAKLCWRRQ